MQEINDIQPIIEPNYLIIILGIICISSIILVIFTLIFKFIYNRFLKPTEKNEPPRKEIVVKIDYKQEALKKLKVLESEILENRIALSESYSSVSETVRWFIEGVKKNQALKKTKTELEYMKINKLNELLNEAYEVVFAKGKTEQEATLRYINSAIKIIEAWH